VNDTEGAVPMDEKIAIQTGKLLVSFQSTANGLVETGLSRTTRQRSDAPRTQPGSLGKPPSV